MWWFLLKRWFVETLTDRPIYIRQDFEWSSEYLNVNGYMLRIDVAKPTYRAGRIYAA